MAGQQEPEPTTVELDKDQCANCKWFTPQNRPGPLRLGAPVDGACRGGPPQLVILPARPPRQGIEVASQWPSVRETELCGAHERRHDA